MTIMIKNTVQFSHIGLKRENRRSPPINIVEFIFTLRTFHWIWKNKDRLIDKYSAADFTSNNLR